jgi:pimeloyl-ACP methyl ester carboxylesterase
VRPTFALVHGGQQGAWVFDLLRGELDAKGFGSIAVELPASDTTAGTARYAEIITSALSTVAGDVVLLGHSMGGLTIPLVALQRPISRLVFLCAAYPEPGRSHFDVRSNQPGESVAAGPQSAWATPGDSHMLSRDLARDLFFHDCPPPLQEWALDRLRPQARRPMTEVTPLTRWPNTPRTLIIASEDRCIPRESAISTARRLFGEAPIEVPGGHCPSLSRPALLASMLVDLTVC